MFNLGKHTLKTLLAFSVCLIAGCGDGTSTSGTTTGGGSTTTGSGDSSGSKVFGDCTLTGNMANFEVICTKDIKNFQMVTDMGMMTSGASLNISVGGKSVKIEKTDAKTLKGTASGYPKLDFTANHTDGTASNITVNP